jgi:hypothetical protein
MKYKLDKTKKEKAWEIIPLLSLLFVAGEGEPTFAAANMSPVSYQLWMFFEIHSLPFPDFSHFSLFIASDLVSKNST